MDFTSRDNICGQNLLRLTSRGSAIIAELNRLADNVPEVFLGAEKITDPQQAKYLEVLFDFHYLRDPEDFEKKINDSSELLELDQEFQENHTEILARFYGLFESVWKYQSDFNKYIEDVTSGFYIQHSVDNILDDTDGKQLMCEALYLYGVMLLLLEERIPGAVREKMIVAIIRENGEGNLENMDDVSKLCRSTGYIPGLKKPKNHPEAFFNRFPFPLEFIRAIISKLQMDDLYLMAQSFPSPEHRSTRLGAQASMLYVILYFAPDILNKDKSTMREIVDRHFNDNWVIPTYMGHTIDLTTEWGPHPAAKAALDNVLTTSFVQSLAEKNLKNSQKATQELAKYLVEGVLIQDYVLDNMTALLNCARNCNVVLRWRILHGKCDSEAFRKIISSSTASSNAVVTLLLNASQMEYILKEIMQQLLLDKDMAWKDGKEQAADRMVELSEYFTGEKALTRVKRDDNMVTWFASLAEKVRSLNLEEDHATATGRKIQGLISALEDVEQFEAVDTNIQIKSYLSEVRDIFRQMIRTVNVKNEVLNILENVTDLSYAWETLPDFLTEFQRNITKDPSSVVLLRATFLKTASILDVPLVRITTIDSPDAESVAEYYSSNLVEFVRKVLEIIPISIFRVLKDIVRIQTTTMRMIPSRLEAKDLKDFADLDQRFELSRQTHEVSVFTEGVLLMERTLLGVIQVEPRQILEEGLRRELVRQVSFALHTDLVFKDTSRGEIVQQMTKLATTLDGLKRSIEYLQDYIGIAGLKMYQEEFARIINYNTEQEANRYLKKKTFDSASRYQSRAIPIPRYSVTDVGDNSGNLTFMGRIASALLSLTDATVTVYAPECAAWFATTASDQKQAAPIETCGIRTFALLERSLGVIGLRGLDKLMAFRTVFEFNQFLKFYTAQVVPFRSLLEQFRDGLFPEHKITANTQKLYATAVKRVEKLMLPILQSIRRIGQSQLLRRQIANLLRFGCQLDAHLFYLALDTFNRGVVNEIQRHYWDPEGHPYPNSDNNPLMEETANLLAACGMDDPLLKIYITTNPLEGLPQILFLFLLTYLPKVYELLMLIF